MATVLHACAPGTEPHLLAELRDVFPGSAHRIAGPGLLWSELTAEDGRLTPALAFARQTVPAPEPLSAPSVARWGQAAADRLIAVLDPHDAPWRLHVFSVAPPGARTGKGRALLVRKSILSELKARRRRLARSLVADDAAPWTDGERLAQVALVSHESGWLSVCGADERQRLRRCLSRWPGGEVTAPEDRRPPSRAYRKLLEAELRSGVAIAAGERCVDLGAAPGSWSWVALQRGARVLAVDRAPLRDDLMRHPQLQFLRGNAFSFTPDLPPPGTALSLPVDWLLCDVIAFPARTLQLIERWTGQRWCRRFVVTVKFKGTDDYPLLQSLKATLDRTGCEFALCQLGANRNEVTVWGTVPAVPAPPAVPAATVG